MHLKALVIDDSGIMRKMVMKSLTESKLAQFEFTEAEDGQVALDKLKAGEFDIAFVDWNMPNMTGIEFVKEVRSHERLNNQDAIPLVMVTSEKTMSKIEEALDEAGADGFITKPFTVDEMQRKMKKHVDKAEVVRIRKDRDQAEAAAQAAKGSGGWFSKLMG